MAMYLLAVDGGGTGTRVIIARPDGTELSRGEAGPGALGQGVAAAWQEIQTAVARAFAAMGVIAFDWRDSALCAGLSGVHNDELAQELRALLPPMRHLQLVTDGYTMLIGAHRGKPGLVVASGTGSVGEALAADGSHRVVGGWGFPVGDEGSGAWLGLRAVAVAQAAMDGRMPVGPLARSVWKHCGATVQAMSAWCANAGQFAYSQVAPLVFENAARDPQAHALLIQAAGDLEKMVVALDPHGELPLAICGSIGQMLQPMMSDSLRRRCVLPAMGPVEGALCLLQQSLKAST